MSYSFFGELKRRNVFKVTGGYILLGWLVLQIADVVVPALNLPEWTMTMLLVIGLFGMPFVIFFAWVYEMTPEGLKLTKEVDKNESITQVTGKKLEYGIIAGLSFAVILLLVKPNLVPRGATEQPEEVITKTTATESAQEIPSIAVLPFEDFSPDKDQGYFSSGISEEILNLLAKTNKLRVAARTSSFAFQGQNADIRDIGQKLKVKTVLEGSIRKFNNKVRITAQLINVEDGYHIWSETYDRELADVFAIQDEISSSIMGSLKVHLLGEEKAIVHKVDLQAYDDFLIANERLQRNTSEDLEAAIKLFQKAIIAEPEYTEAKVKLILAAMQLEQIARAVNRESFIAAEQRTDQLVKQHLEPLTTELDSNYELNGVLGRYHQRRYRYELAGEFLAAALDLNVNYADAYLWRADLYFEKADYKAMLSDREKAYQLDPMSIEISRELAGDYRSFWRPDDAERVIERMFTLFPDHPEAYMAKASNYANHGRYADALLTVEEAVSKHSEDQRFINFMAWGYTYMNEVEKVKAMGLDWTDYELTHASGDLDQSLEFLEEGLKTEKRAEWLWAGVELFMLLENTDRLKSSIVEMIENMDTRNVPWRKRCNTYMIAALEMVEMNDSIQTMMDTCRETTEKRLEAGYFCPCSYFRLVSFAIVDNRFEDAITRAEEWLDNGDSYHKLKVDPLFTRLQAHQKYQTLLERNDQQVQRQRRMYLSKTATTPLSNPEAD